MDQFQQDPNSALGQIQKLMGSVAQNYDPQERNQALQRQETAQQNYNQVLQQPMPDQGPISRMVSDYLTKYAQHPNMAWSAAASAIGTEAGRTQDMEVSQLQRQTEAAKEEARMAGEGVKEADLFSSKFMSTLGRTKGGLGHSPNPEALRTVYTGARNEYAQAAKNYRFGTPSEREQWIEDGANRAVQNYLQNFATQPTGPRGIQPSAEMGQAPQMPQAEGWNNPGTLPQSGEAAQAARNIQEIQAELKKVSNDPTRTLVLQQELQRAQSVLPQQQQTVNQLGGGVNENPPTNVQLPTNKPSQPTMRMDTPPSPLQQAASAVQPVLRNLPKEAADKAGATGMAESYVKDYESVQQAALSAEAQKQAFDNLAKIKPETNALANTQQVIGSLFSALGQDPNSPMIQNAIKTRNANLIISQLNNAGLRAEKGVQTKSDEVRIANEFPKTTDFKQVLNFSIKLGQERAQRTLDQRDFFDRVAESNNGSPTKARQLWNKEMANDPLTQYLGGKLIFRNDFVKAYTAKHPDLGPQAAVEVWREMEQDYQKRGGKK